MGLKSLMKGVIRSVGVDVVRFSVESQTPRADRVRHASFQKLGVKLVLDVGANRGQYAATIRKAGYAGKIVSFEPVAGIFEELQRAAAADAVWQCRQICLGAEAAMAEINVAGNNGESSSILEMGGRHLAAAPESRYTGKQSVRVVRLDDVINDIAGATDEFWLKVDVQGYELQVLAGAAGCLHRAVGIEVELSLVPLYEGQPLIEDVIAWLRARHYQLTSLEEVFCDGRSGETLQLAGTFLRTATPAARQA